MDVTLVIRHAKAGERSAHDDHLRPLTRGGHDQAAGLVDLLATFEIARIVSSPYVRCVQTVEPLATARGLIVETDDVLGEGGRAILADGVAMCSHGDVIGNLLPAGAPCKKGSVWVFENGRPVHYIAPPSVSSFIT